MPALDRTKKPSAPGRITFAISRLLVAGLHYWILTEGTCALGPFFTKGHIFYISEIYPYASLMSHRRREDDIFFTGIFSCLSGSCSAAGCFLLCAYFCHTSSILGSVSFCDYYHNWFCVRHVFCPAYFFSGSDLVATVRIYFFLFLTVSYLTGNHRCLFVVV